MYLVFSASRFPSAFSDGIHDNTINSASGIAVPTPFTVRPKEMTLALSLAFGVMMFGSVQKGTSETVYVMPQKT